MASLTIVKTPYGPGTVSFTTGVCVPPELKEETDHRWWSEYYLEEAGIAEDAGDIAARDRFLALAVEKEQCLRCRRQHPRLNLAR